MVKIKGTTIKMTRGDTLRVRIHAMRRSSEDGDYIEYEPEDGDTIRFALSKSYSDSSPLIYKNIPTDSMVLELEPGDTKQLSFGSYVYDIELTFSDGSVDTFIAEAVLELTPEVA